MVVRKVNFALAHLMPLLIFVTGTSAVAVWTCLALYALRLFAITGGYHRYFAHRSYKAGRPMQIALAVLGAAAAQKGPLWWAAYHRLHHAHSDQPDDIHSPVQHGFWWAHVGWIVSEKYGAVRWERIKDLAKDRVLVLIDQYHALFPLTLALVCYGAGMLFERYYPQSGTNGMQLMIWGFFVSTVMLWHATFFINSLCHLWGTRRFETSDTSRNNLLLALLLFGEGWHNNHHYYQSSERQGFYWWEIDITHYILRLLAMLGLVSGLRAPPARVFARLSRPPVTE